MLQDISSQAKEHQRAEECLAGNMGPTASSLNQQGHSELHKKNSSLFESRDIVNIVLVVPILIAADRRPESTTSSSSIAPCSSRSSHSPPSSSPSILSRRPPIVFSAFPVPFFRPHIPGI